MFLLNTQIEVELCCSCLSIYILIRLSEDMLGGDEHHFRKLFNISAVQVSLLKFTEQFDVGAADY